MCSETMEISAARAGGYKVFAEDNGLSLGRAETAEHAHHVRWVELIGLQFSVLDYAETIFLTNSHRALYIP